MFRTTSLTAVCLILASANSAVAQKPFKNKTARAAQKVYEAAIVKAKKEYVAKLEIAIKEAGGAGDVDEFNKIATEKKRVDGSDPVEKARKRIEGTRWGQDPKMPTYFLANRKVRFADGSIGVWIMTMPRTLVLQTRNYKTIAVYNFDEKMKFARMYRFNKGTSSVYRKY
ncbi:MAG: hypothetical protein IID46_15890 [Planctomycetes bacterium]|nr:hypothetical protein [Planctomycetota bacterium]